MTALVQLPASPILPPAGELVSPGPAAEFRPAFVLGALRRHWLVIGATATLITTAAVGYAWTRPPVYAATAQLMIGVPSAPTLDLGLLAGLPVDRDRVRNEVHVLESRTLVRQVVEQAGLDREPEFNPALDAPAAGPGLAERLTALLPAPVAALLEAWRAPGAGGEGPAAVWGRAPVEDVVDRVLGALTVEPDSRSHLIYVTVETGEPQLSARAANALAETYLAGRLDDKLASARRAAGWLDQRLETLRADLERKEAAVEAYRSRAGLVKGKGAALTADRIGDLNRELALAKAAEAVAQARVLKAEETVQRQGPDAVSEVLASRTIQELRGAEAVAAARQAELARDLGPRHPRMADIRAQLQGLRAQLDAETRRILDSVRAEYDVARTRSASLQREIDRLEALISDRNDGEAELRVLEREAAAAQEVYRTFLVQAKATGELEGLESADARLISAAVVPARPAGPNRKMLVLIGFAGACCAGVGLAFAIELLDRRFRSADQLRQQLHLPVLGVVPMLGSLCATREAPQDHVISGPGGAFAEAIRALRTRILLSGEGRSPRTVLITSSVQGEGKTTLCLSIGRQAAQAGRRAIVVDGDLRLPRVHDGLGLAPGPGLIEFLRGAEIGEVVRRDPRSGLFVISAGRWRREAPELLRAPRLGKLIKALRTEFDLVLIDTPPLLPVADASLLAGHADLAVLVVGWASARPDVVEVAAERLREAARGARIGAVLNNVDVHKVAGYGFAELEAYRGRYAGYHAAA